MNAYEMAEQINRLMAEDLSLLGFEGSKYLRDLEPRTQLDCLNYLRCVRTTTEIVENEIWGAINGG